MIPLSYPQLKAVMSLDDIPATLRNTPFEVLLRCHNLGEDGELCNVGSPQLLVSMCMDNRKRVELPENYAFILRSGGGNIRHNEFKLAYAIAIGRISHVALIGHTDCGMAGLHKRKDQFVEGMEDLAGWNHEQAETFFQQFSPLFEISDPMSFTANEVQRLQAAYPKVRFEPFLYRIEDGKLYWLDSSAV